MKTYALALAFSAISLSVSTSAFAATTTAPTTGPTSRPTTGSDESPYYKSGYPKHFIMMKRGKLVEVNHGHQKSVKKDVTLINETTIHPNGAIDAGSGQSLRLKEGQYITMDGKIRYLKDMGRK